MIPNDALRHFESIPGTTPKVSMEMAGGDRFFADTNRGRDLATVSRYALARFELHLDGHERYRELLFGARPDGDAEKFARYVADP